MATIFKQILKQSLTNRSKLHIKSTLFLDSSNTTNTAEASTILNKDTLKKLISTNKVVIFMKGNPESPRCGFSNAVVQILRMHGVQYDAHDVLKSEELRQGIKEFTDWPTIPQIFINGVFIGGCDILLQMHQSGDLIEELKKVGIESLLLKEKLNQVKDNKKNAKKDS